METVEIEEGMRIPLSKVKSVKAQANQEAKGAPFHVTVETFDYHVTVNCYSIERMAEVSLNIFNAIREGKESVEV